MVSRPSKSAREAARLANGWSTQPVNHAPAPSPKFDPISAFCAGEDDTIPNPGAYEGGLSFFPPDVSETFESAFLPFPVCRQFSEKVESLRTYEPELFSSGISGASVSHSLLAAGSAAVGVNVFKHSVDGDLELEGVHPKFPKPLSQVIESVGEFQSSDGFPWSFPSPESTALAFIRIGVYLEEGGERSLSPSLFWAPTKPGDPRTAGLLAAGISQSLRGLGFPISVPELATGLLRFEAPPHLVAFLKTREDSIRDAVLPWFQRCVTLADFCDRVSNPSFKPCLSIAGVSWSPALNEVVLKPLHISQGVNILKVWMDVFPNIPHFKKWECTEPDLRVGGNQLQLARASSHLGGTRVWSQYPLSDQEVTISAVSSADDFLAWLPAPKILMEHTFRSPDQMMSDFLCPSV